MKRRVSHHNTASPSRGARGDDNRRGVTVLTSRRDRGSPRARLCVAPFCRGPLVVACGLCGLRAQLQQVSPLGVLERQFVQGCTGAPRNYNEMTHELRIDPTSPDLRALTFVSTLRSFNNVTLHERIGLDETKTVDPNFFLGMKVRHDVSAPSGLAGLSQLRATATTTPRSPRGITRRRAAARARARTAATGSSTSTTSGTTPRRSRRSGSRPRRRTPCRPASRAPAASRTPRSTTTTRGATTARLRATSEGSGTRGRRPARARRLRAR